jgi:N-methylhydantoinase A
VVVPVRVVAAVDTGGTFTDVVAVVHQGDRSLRLATAKPRSTPHDPARAVAAGLREVCAALQVAGVDVLLHGTTVATNELLQRTQPPPMLVLNAGMEGLLDVGRQHRRQLYALQPANAARLVPADQVVGVGGRLDARGREVEALDLQPLDAVLAGLDAAPRRWAVCLLHSWASPVHEDAVMSRLRARRPQDAVSVSSSILPVFREVERAATTVANAQVQGLMQGYLDRLRPLAPRVWIMGSAGGLLTLDEASRVPVQTALSGPAGGVVGAARTGAAAGLLPLVAFDMGGTSTDIAVVEDRVPVRHDAEVGDWPLALSMLDIHTIGAGGGSLITVDPVGALQVGPRSAGADPGPACFGEGTLPTLTDAHLLAGRLDPDLLLGGHTALHPDRARAALADLAHRTGLTAEAVARGAITIASEAMAQAIRSRTVARGIDPRQLTLVAFGGAGGLHICDVARLLDCPRAWLPPRAGLLSAVGMALATPRQAGARTVLGLDADARATLARDALAELATAHPDAHCRFQADLRYQGQSFELTVPWDPATPAADGETAFLDAHDQRFGYRLPDDTPVEWVTLRWEAEGPRPPELTEVLAEEIAGELPAGPLPGPARWACRTHALWVEAGWVATPDATGGLLLTRTPGTA